MKKRDDFTKRKNIGMKYVLLLGALLLATVLLSNLVRGQETLYCAEKTISGVKCINVPLDEVNTNFRYDRTSCESTTYCSTGTCVNTATGECLPSSQSACDPSQGGYFYDKSKDDVPQCQQGCCILGDQTNFVERNRCDTLGKDLGVTPAFRSDVKDEITCLSLSSPDAKGACTFDKEEGRTCNFGTRSECQDASGEFHEGFLCSAPELGTICAKTQRTTCVLGKNEVYFVDSCGNLANVYDANKVDDVAYWSYVPGVQGVEVNEGDNKGNIGSKIYGSCDYLSGSTCGSGDAKYGNYICSDLRCPASDPLSGGKLRQQGEEWCSEPLKNFETAKPGDESYLLSCFNGEIQYELCDYSRNKLCLEDEETGHAGCVVNRWLDCTEQTTTKDCLNSDERDCKVVGGSSVAFLRTQYGTEKKLTDSTGEKITAACVPRYTPGFKFWDPENTLLDTGEETPMSICEFSSVVCRVPYTQSVIGITDWRVTPDDACVQTCQSVEGWSDDECYKACTPVCLEQLDHKNSGADINKSWAESYQNLCVSLGDCGVSSNYLGKSGYNAWNDLFSGEQIHWDTLPNGDGRTAVQKTSTTSSSSSTGGSSSSDSTTSGDGEASIYDEQSNAN